MILLLTARLLGEEGFRARLGGAQPLAHRRQLGVQLFVLLSQLQDVRLSLLYARLLSVGPCVK